MPKRFLGNIMTDAPTAPEGPYENDAASGVWSLAEALSYTKGGLWPTAGNSQRGVIGGGFSASDTRTNVLQYISIGSLGNSTDFGDMTIAATSRGGMASSTRGVYSGGSTGSNSNVIDYITILSTGNATDFGDATTAHDPNSNGGASSSTRGVFSLGIA